MYTCNPFDILPTSDCTICRIVFYKELKSDNFILRYTLEENIVKQILVLIDMVEMSTDVNLLKFIVIISLSMQNWNI